MIVSDTKTYWKKLASIPWSYRGKTYTKPIPWIYTSDHAFASIIPTIIEKVKIQKRTRNLRVAIFSGVGSLLTIAPFVKVDFFICVDRNSFVLDMARKMVETIQEASNPWEFIQKFQLDTLFADLKVMKVDPEPYWITERESFKFWHFLASVDNYNNTRKTLLEKPVYYTQGDFTNRYYIQGLSQALKGTNISYAGFSDQAEQSPEFLDFVRHLPITQDAVIVWATNQGQPKGEPLTKISVGPDTYIQEQQALLAENKVTRLIIHEIVMQMMNRR